MKRRRGYTLVEMVVVICVASVLLGLTVMLLHALLQTNQGARRYVREVATQGRLAEQFRRDVHAATAIDAACGQLTFDGDRTVTYTAAPGQITRTDVVGEAVRQREEFALAAELSARIEADGERRLVSLLIEPVSGESNGGVLQIDAVLGYDHRLLEHETR